MLRASLRAGRAAAGTWKALAAAMGVTKDTLKSALNGRIRISGDLAVRLARALKVPLESLTTPGLHLVPIPKICPACGRG